jgi:hypothetical protein
MTSECYVCGKTLMEKCYQCGTPSLLSMNWKGIQWLCPNSGCPVRWFDQGEGGTSHGLCEPCEKIEREQLFQHRQLPKFIQFFENKQ